MTLKSMLKQQIDISLISDKRQIKYAKDKLRGKFLSTKDAKAAMRALIAYEKKYIVEYDDVRELLAEVIDDMEWLDDKKNSIVLWVDKNSKRIEKLITKRYCIKEIMIRAHVNKECLCVMMSPNDKSNEILKHVERLSGYKAVSFAMKSS